jgi:hypothetical protein
VPSFILSNLMEAYYHRPGRPWPRNQSRLKEPEHRFGLFSIRRCFRCVYVCRLIILFGTARGSLTISYHCKWVLYIRPALGAQLKSVQGVHQSTPVCHRNFTRIERYEQLDCISLHAAEFLRILFSHWNGVTWFAMGSNPHYEIICFLFQGRTRASQPPLHRVGL